MTTQASLAALGLEPEEEALYRALVELPSTTLGELSRTLRLPAEQTDRLLSVLLAQGLVARTNDGRFVATSPAVALGPLVRRRREDLRRAELELASLTERFWISAGDRTAGDLVEVITGVELISQRFVQVQASAIDNVQALVTSHTVAVGRRDHPTEDDAVRRGVHYRVVVEREILEQQGADVDLTSAINSGEEVRIVERVPIKLMIVDRALAMVPMDVDGRAPAALLVHRSGLLDALVALFELVWEKARPMRPDLSEVEDATALDDEDRQILMLLLAGLTDSSIAGQLGLSMRTVQRRVRELMDLAGVHTRLQLGWHAAKAGWA